jgi:hypothetical protein
MFKNFLNLFNVCALLFALVFLIGTGKAYALTCSSPLWTGAVPTVLTLNQTTCPAGQDLLLSMVEVTAINSAATGLNCVPSVVAGSPVTVSYYNPSGCGTGYALFTAAQYSAFLAASPAPVVTPAASSPVASAPIITVLTISTPFDPILAASFWSFAMTMVVGCWLVAHNAGLILRFIQGRRY